MSKQDPIRRFRFHVEIDGITGGAFSSVKGLGREIKYESYREGGVNDYQHQLFSQVSNPLVVLEKGLMSEDLWQWAQASADGNINRKNLRIILANESGEKVWAWQIENAIPVKWSVSDLEATSSNVAMESLELAHHGIRKST